MIRIGKEEKITEMVKEIFDNWICRFQFAYSNKKIYTISDFGYQPTRKWISTSELEEDWDDDSEFDSARYYIESVVSLIFWVFVKCSEDYDSNDIQIEVFKTLQQIHNKLHLIIKNEYKEFFKDDEYWAVEDIEDLSFEISHIDKSLSGTNKTHC
jgi:hypothetical protein